MKNKILIFFLIFFYSFFNKSFAENVLITAKNISIDKDKNKTIFENEVVVETQNKIIESDYEMDRKVFIIY